MNLQSLLEIARQDTQRNGPDEFPVAIIMLQLEKW